MWKDGEEGWHQGGKRMDLFNLLHQDRHTKGRYLGAQPGLEPPGSYGGPKRGEISMFRDHQDGKMGCD